MLEQLAKRNELSPAILPELRSIFAGLVPISTWQVLGPFPFEGGPSLASLEPVDSSATFDGVGGKSVTWKTAKAIDRDGQIDLGRVYNSRRRPGRLCVTPRSRARPSGKRRWSSAPTTR